MYIENKEDFLSYYLPNYDEACNAWEKYEQYWNSFSDVELPDLEYFDEVLLENLTYQVLSFINNLLVNDYEDALMEAFWESPWTACSFDIRNSVYVDIDACIDYIKEVTGVEPSKEVNNLKILSELNQAFDCKFI